MYIDVIVDDYFIIFYRRYMLFINISSDKILLDDGVSQELLSRNGIENTLGPQLIDRYRNRPFQEIFVLNGPGGFTNLRVGSLMINMLNVSLEEKIQIYSANKLQVYGALVAQGVLPSQGIIYLGQKHNVWLADFTQTPVMPSVINLQNIPSEAFLDEVYDSYWPEANELMVQWTNVQDTPTMSYQGKSYPLDRRALGLQAQTQIQAEYMIEPTMN